MISTLASRCLLVLLLSHVGGHAESIYLLRRKLVAGTTDTYVIKTTGKQTMSIPQAGEQTVPMSMELTYAIKTGKVDPSHESAAVTATVTYTKMDMPGAMGGAMGGAMPQQKPSVLQGTISSLGVLSMTGLGAKASSISSLMSPGTDVSTGILIQFPKKRLKIGDTWETPPTQVTDPSLSLTGKCLNKLVGVQQYKGKPALVIDGTMNLTMALDMSKLFSKMGAGSGDQQAALAQQMAQAKMTMNGKLHIVTHGLVDPSSGKTIQLSTTTSTDLVMEMAAQGMKIPMKSTMTSTATLK